MLQSRPTNAAMIYKKLMLLQGCNTYPSAGKAIFCCCNVATMSWRTHCIGLSAVTMQSALRYYCVRCGAAVDSCELGLEFAGD